MPANLAGVIAGICYYVCLTNHTCLTPTFTFHTTNYMYVVNHNQPWHRLDHRRFRAVDRG